VELAAAVHGLGEVHHGDCLELADEGCDHSGVGGTGSEEVHGPKADLTKGAVGCLCGPGRLGGQRWPGGNRRLRRSVVGEDAAHDAAEKGTGTVNLTREETRTAPKPAKGLGQGIVRRPLLTTDHADLGIGESGDAGAGHRICASSRAATTCSGRISPTSWARR